VRIGAEEALLVGGLPFPSVRRIRCLDTGRDCEVKMIGGWLCATGRCEMRGCGLGGRYWL